MRNSEMNVPSIGLQRRIVLYMALGLFGLFGVFAYVAIDSANRSSSFILEERVTLANLVASSIDSNLVVSRNLVQEAAEDASSRVYEQAELELIANLLASALDELFQQPGGSSTVFFNGQGDFVAGHQQDRFPVSVADLLTDNDASDYRVVRDSDGNAVIGFTTQITGVSGATGWLVALIHPGAPVLTISTGSDLASSQYRVELIASGGEVIGTSDPGEFEATSRHSDILAGLIDGEEPKVVEHALLDTADEPVNHVVAFSPLKGGSLGIVLEQPEDVALALPNDLRRRILMISGVGLAMGLAIAWLTTRQVVRPLEVLNRNARSIAQGRLDQLIEPSGRDEIRRLGESFEIMRSRLSVSVSELQKWGSELEHRVQERTAELLARNQERDALLDKVITAQEDERTRVARDLHDQVGQSLTALVMQLGAAETQLGKQESGSVDHLRATRESLSETIEDVRRLISDLRPSVLDDMGLDSAVRWYVEQRLKDAGIETDIDVAMVDVALSPTTEISVFRIFQEAINNVVKHANANSVSILMMEEDGHLVGVVKDDGEGFDPGPVLPAGDGGWAVGLIGMRERINLLHGAIEILSSRGDGTTVSFRIPLQPK